jgi:hypothetical protein
VQRAEVLAEPLGHHVDPPIDEVDGGAARRRLLVDGGARLDEVADVGDVHAHLEPTVAELPRVQRVVDVHAAGRVDRAHERAAVAQVEPARRLLRRHRPPLGGQARLHLRREGRRVDLVLKQDRLRLRPRVAHLRRRRKAWCAWWRGAARRAVWEEAAVRPGRRRTSPRVRT